MSELAEPLSRLGRAAVRLEALERLHDQQAVLEVQLRQELVAFAQDLGFGMRDYACDELAPALGESPRTMQTRLEHARRFVAFPVVMAQVALPLAEGGWSIRHAEALLDVISGVGLTDAQQAQVIDLVIGSAGSGVGSPRQVRLAAQAAVMVIDPEAAARRWEKAKKDRSVLTEAFNDDAILTALGSKGQIAMLWAAIDAHAGPQQPGDDRSRGAAPVRCPDRPGLRPRPSDVLAGPDRGQPHHPRRRR